MLQLYMWVKNLVKHPLCMAEVEVRRVSPEEEERCRMIRMGYFNLFHRGWKALARTYAFQVPLEPMLGVGSVFDGVLSIVWKPPAIRYRENCRRYREKYLHKLHKFETQTLSPLIFLGLRRSGIKHIFKFKSIIVNTRIYIIVYIYLYTFTHTYYLNILWYYIIYVYNEKNTYINTSIHQ